MPNIFDGIKKMDDEQLQYQLASLEEVTLGNVMSEMGQKAQNGTVKLYNGLRKLTNKTPVTEPVIISMEERINSKKIELDELNRDALHLRMKKVLAEKVYSVNLSRIADDSEDIISVRVIETATKCFGKEIAENLTPGQKADAIYHRYNEKLLDQLKKKYDKASKAEKAEIASNIQKDIDAMTDEQKAEMQKALGIEKITEEALSKLIKSTAGVTALMVALDISGFGAYMALTTIMHAIFTTTLGITLPFALYTAGTGVLSFLMGPAGLLIFVGLGTADLLKNKNKFIYELLAQVVWTSVMMCGGRFTPKEDTLPSWLPQDQRDTVINESAELLEMVAEKEKINAKYQKLQNEVRVKRETLTKKEQKIEELNRKIEGTKKGELQAKSETEGLELAIRKAKEKLDAQQRIIDALKIATIDEKTQADYDKAKREYNHAIRKLGENEKTICSLGDTNNELLDEMILKEGELKTVKLQKAEVEKQYKNTQKINSKMQDELEILSDKAQGKLEPRWEKVYKKFIFEPSVIKSVVKNFAYNEYGSIEGVLMELHEAKDPAAIKSNRGKMAASEELHLGFSSTSGFPSRVFYKSERNLPNGKTIIITKICKHNDPRYGK